MQSVYHHFGPYSSSFKELVPQSFRRRDISTVNMFLKENLYIKNSLLNSLSINGIPPRGIRTIPLVPLSLKTNYKRLVTQNLVPSFFRSPLYNSTKTRQRLFGLPFYRMAAIQKHLFLQGRRNKLFRMKYKKLHLVLSNKALESTPNSELRSFIKKRATQKYLFRVSNRKKYV